MANITLARAIKVFTSELGCSGTNARENLIEEITIAIEWMMHSGGGNILREWRIPVRRGRFTLPRDLETPIKFKFGRNASAGFGMFSSPYHSYGSNSIQDCSGYYDWGSSIEVKANTVPTQNCLQSSCVQVIATTRNDRDVGKKIVVGGKQNGMAIVPLHNNIKTSGEVLTVYKEDDVDKLYSSFKFDEITSVVKDNTCDYITLTSIDDDGNIQHLAHYHPDDTVPSFTECEMVNCSCWGHFGLGQYHQHGDYMLHILGRVNPSIEYIRDEDILPISSFNILKMLAKRARQGDQGEIQMEVSYEARIEKAIRKQVSYQQPADRKMSVGLSGSGATLSNL